MREHAVRDDEIVASFGRLEEPFTAVARVIHGVAALAQSFQQELRRTMTDAGAPASSGQDSAAGPGGDARTGSDARAENR